MCAASRSGVYSRILGGLRYEGADFFGISDAAANQAARVLVEYAFYFRGHPCSPH